MSDSLDIYSIYHSVPEFPGKHVLRRDKIERKGPPMLTLCLPFDTLEQARKAVPFGLFRILPTAEDPPNLIEAWL